MLKSKLAENSIDDPQLHFESLDSAIEDHDVLDLNDSHNIEMEQRHDKKSKQSPSSKLRKLSTSIASKIKSKKMKKGGFERIDDNYNYDHESDKAEDIIPSKVPTKSSPKNTDENTLSQTNRPYFHLKICGRICLCTKTKTIVCIASIIIFFLVIFIMALAHDFNASTSINCMNGRKVLIISLDGFRAEYLNRIPTPNIQKYFINAGVSVTSMKPVFPSKTFPNHYSIVTGLYPPSHGIVSNHFWDPVLKKTFDIGTEGNDSTGNWFKGEPIWNTIKLMDLTSAALQYPGSSARCGGRIVNGKDISGYPTYYRPHYDPDWDYAKRIDLTVELLSDTTPNYDLILLYFSQPDHDGHTYGPNSDEVYNTVIEMDDYIGSLMEKMVDNDVLDITDVILLSDHGMTNVEKYNNETYLNEDSKIIVLDKNIFPFDGNDVIIRDRTPIMGVYLNGSRFNNVEEAMDLMRNAIVHNGDKCDIYKNGDIPYITYNNTHEYHNRVPDFIVASHLGYSIFVDGFSTPDILGTHGYNNSEDDMQAIFMARGPSFKSGVVINDDIDFENVGLYEMFCSLLCNVEPNDNNGTRDLYSKYLFK